MADGFVGGTYNLNSVPASAQRTINMMPVPVEAGNERTAYTFRDVPGLLRFAVKDYIYITSQPYAYEADETVSLRATTPFGGGLFNAMPFDVARLSTLPQSGVLKTNLVAYTFSEDAVISTLPQRGVFGIAIVSYGVNEEQIPVKVLPQTGALTIALIPYTNYGVEQISVLVKPQIGALT